MSEILVAAFLCFWTRCPEAAMQDMQVESFTEKEYEIVRLENVGEVLFQVLLLDNVCSDDGRIYSEYVSIYLIGG